MATPPENGANRLWSVQTLDIRLACLLLFPGSFVDIHRICFIVSIYTRHGDFYGNAWRVNPIRNWTRSLDLLQAKQISIQTRVCNEEDWSAIKLVLGGDVAAFNQLMKRYQGMVFSQATKAFDTQDEAEDFTQEVFLKAYESLSTFRGEAQFSTWIYQIARNEISKHFKKKKPHLEPLEDFHGSKSKKDASSGVLEQISKDEDGNLLRTLISRLPAAYRKPIILHYFDNRSLKEISDTLDIKLNTIKSHISRGKDLIRKWWQHE